MKNKKITIILVIVILILIAFLFIFIGFFFDKRSNPKYLVGVGLDAVYDKFDPYYNMIDKYYVGDSFKIESNIDMNLDSEKYLQDSTKDIEALKNYKYIKNLSNLNTTILYKQDSKDKKVYLEAKQLLGNEELLYSKYLIDNSTEYYFVNNILDSFVNAGTNNYFEMLDKEHNSLDNMHYLHDFIKEAIKNSLKEEYFTKYQVSTNIDGHKKDVNQISMKITDKLIHNILNDVLDELKNDERANKILSSINEDFKKTKIKDSKVFLDKDEYYTLNIYSSKYFNKALKFELFHMKGDYKESYTYEGDSTVGTIYYVKNDNVVYEIDASFQDKVMEFIIHDSSSQELGNLKIENDDMGVYITYSFDDGKKKCDIIYSSKYLSFKKNNSYTNEKKIDIKLLENKVSIINGTVAISTMVSKDSKIDEDTSNSVLESTLTDKQKELYEGKLSRVHERLKR